MHYCQACPSPVLMEPAQPEAVCPACGRREPVRRRPLFVVTGASGSGKTTVFPHLAGLVTDQLVFDVDWLIDPIGRIRAPQPMDWINFRAAWLAVAHGVAQAGRSTVLLGPFINEHLADLPERRWIGPIHFGLLDCEDELRRTRLLGRPAWRERKLDEQLEFATQLRRLIPTRFDTTHSDPSATAAEIAAWVSHLDSPAAP